MKAAASVGEVPVATFSGGYLPQGGEQVATVVLCCIGPKRYEPWVR